MSLRSWYAAADRVQRGRTFKAAASIAIVVLAVASFIAYAIHLSHAHEAADPLAPPPTVQNGGSPDNALDATRAILDDMLAARTDATGVGVGIGVGAAVALAIIWLDLGLTYLMIGAAAGCVVALSYLTPFGRSYAPLAMGVLALAAAFMALMRLARLLLGPSHPVTAIAGNVLAEAVRMRVSFVFIVLILFALAALPTLLTADQPLRYRVQSFLQYGTGGTYALISILVVCFSVATVAFDQRDKTIWQTITKPVSPWQYVLGKWLGVATLSAVLLAVSGAGVFLFVEYLRAQPALGEESAWVTSQAGGGGDISEDRFLLESQVLTARMAVKNSPMLFDRQAFYNSVAERFKEELERRRQGGERISAADEQKMLDEIGGSLEKSVQVMYRSIRPGSSQQFLFEGLGPARTSNRPVILRFKINSGSNAPDALYRLTLQFSGAEAEVRQVPLSHWQTVHLLPRVIGDDGTVQLTVTNGDVYQRVLNQDTIIFPPDGLEISYTTGSYRANFLRVMLILWAKLAFLAMLGVCLATFLSFPVAILVACTIFFAAEGGAYLHSALENFWTEDEKGKTLLINTVVSWVATPVAWVFKGYGDLKPSARLVEGLRLPWMKVLASGGLLLVWTTILFFAGAYALRRRELATYSGHWNTITVTRDTRIQLLASLVLAGCLAGSVALAVSLTGQAGRAKIVYTDRAEANAPWEVSVGIAMGAFRGVFVNYLWMRANDMKEAGKFFEAIQLADAITRLQPRFSRVWVFHAWNMSYNISVETQTREERWEWVKAGIELLRDEGIPANPNDMLLHKELGWIFLHKIGGFTDDSNLYYKKELAKEWTIVLGQPPGKGPEDRDRDKAIGKYVAWLTPIAEAPDTPEEMWAKNPQTKVLGDRLRAAGVRGDFELLRGYELWQAAGKLSQRSVFKANAGQRTKALGALIDDPQFKDAWKDLLAYLRKRILVDVYHMEPDRMIRFTREVGPLDWRHHGSHALYWSLKGVEVGSNRVTQTNQRDFDFLNTDRVVVQSIQDLFRSGDLYFDFFASMFPDKYALLMGTPNEHFLESYGKMLEPMQSRGGIFTDIHKRANLNLVSGYENFLKDSITFYYARGDKRRAEELHKELRTHRLVNFITDGDEALDLDAFVFKNLNDEWTRPSIAVAQVSAALQGAFASGLLGGDANLFRSQMEWANTAHKLFFTEQSRFNAINPEDARMNQLPEDFRLAAGIQFQKFLESLGLDDAEIVYERAPGDLRAYGYDFLADRFRKDLDDLYAAQKENGARSFDEIFPEPPGLPEVRAAIAAWVRRLEELNVRIESR